MENAGSIYWIHSGYDTRGDFMPEIRSNGKANEIVSMIILASGQFNYTKECIESIREHTEKGSYEIIVIDNHSQDETLEWLKAQNDLKIIANRENLGFPKGCNQGIKIARGNKILLLNNDTVVTRNWLTNLLSCLGSSPDIGAVGPVTNYCSNFQQIPVTYGDSDSMQKFAAEYNVRDENKWEQVVKLVGYCLLIKKEALDKAGLLDERFSPGNYEDDDIGLRIQQAGYKLILCRDTFIHHYGSMSFRKNIDMFSQALQKNREKFTDKWGFDPSGNLFKQTEITDLVHLDGMEQPRILQVGCGCGATLLSIRYNFRSAQLYGIEANEKAAEIAGLFADVKSVAPGEAEYPDAFFDSILFTGIFEYEQEPWELLGRYCKYLKPGGVAVAEILNAMYYPVVTGLLYNGLFYTGGQAPEKRQLRFFTPNAAQNLFGGAGLEDVQVQFILEALPREGRELSQKLSQLSGVAFRPMYSSSRYLLSARKPETDGPTE